MLKYCVDQWEKNKGRLRATFENCSIYSDYEDFARIVIENIFPEWDNYKLNVVYQGGYTGDVIFFINADSSDYGTRSSIFLSELSYGSCSVCDALQHAAESEERTEDFMQIALHFIQNMIHPLKNYYYEDKYDIVAK